MSATTDVQWHELLMQVYPRLDPKITLADAKFLAALLRRRFIENDPSPSYADLSVELGVGRNHLRIRARKLEYGGYIVRDWPGGFGATNTFHVDALIERLEELRGSTGAPAARRHSPLDRPPAPPARPQGAPRREIDTETLFQRLDEIVAELRRLHGRLDVRDERQEPEADDASPKSAAEEKASPATEAPTRAINGWEPQR